MSLNNRYSSALFSAFLDQCRAGTLKVVPVRSDIDVALEPSVVTLSLTLVPGDDAVILGGYRRKVPPGTLVYLRERVQSNLDAITLSTGSEVSRYSLWVKDDGTDPTLDILWTPDYALDAFGATYSFTVTVGCLALGDAPEDSPSTPTSSGKRKQPQNVYGPGRRKGNHQSGWI